MSRPSTPIYVSSCNSTPSPSLSSDSENAALICQIHVHHARGHLPLALTQPTPSPPSNSPDERTSNGLDLAIHGRMTTTATIPTAAQIQQNAIEDAREYHDKRIEELTDQLCRELTTLFK